ncbi:type II and III secretion system protein family protein [Vibrio salinus]|uniref:type II and III secretion system protein family protein n=1 Tax=Vibrio salinus TaxID=2899784 RepID=UPI001E36159E|nr:type II and III secretion system protein family protein [Vibrio salinus]MCE0495914.1 type II and III secretion system protein family protein [Vibrio salinus]
MKTFHKEIKNAAYFIIVCMIGMPLAFAGQNIIPKIKTVKTTNFSQIEVHDTIHLTVSKGRLLSLPARASKVLVANPDIASFQMPSSTNIFVFANEPGTTTLYALDNQDRVILATHIIAGFDLESLTEQINTEIVGADVKLLSSTENGILVRGSVQTPQQAKQVIDAITAYTGGDSDVSSSGGGNANRGGNNGGGSNSSVRIVNQLHVKLSAQINISVRIVEVSRSLDTELGFSWESLLDNGKYFIRNTSSALFDASTGIFSSDSVSNALAGGASGNLGGVLSALSTNGLASILAEPNLTAMSGETAGFAAGGEVPIVMITNNTTSIDFKQYGVIMRMTPTLLSPNRISLHIAPEVSDLSDDGAIELEGTKIPAFKVRRADTTVELASGQSFALAGMLRSGQNLTVNGVPGLRNIPILGHLFESSSNEKEETELVIIATAYVVTPTNAGDLQVPGKGIKTLDNAMPKKASAGYLF